MTFFRFLALTFAITTCCHAEDRWPLNCDEDTDLLADVCAPWEDVPMPFTECEPRHIRRYTSGGERLSDEELYAPTRQLDYVTRRHAAVMKRRHQLRWQASYNLDDETVDHIHLVYECVVPNTVEQARDVLVDLVESYLSVVNKYDPPLVQLGHHPFTADNLKIELHFDTFFGNYVDRMMVEWVTLSNGIVSYQAYNCNRGDKCFTRREKYQQAYHGSMIAKEFAESEKSDQAALEAFFREAFKEEAPAPAPKEDQRRAPADSNWRMR